MGERQHYAAIERLEKALAVIMPALDQQPIDTQIEFMRQFIRAVPGLESSQIVHEWVQRNSVVVSHLIQEGMFP